MSNSLDPDQARHNRTYPISHNGSEVCLTVSVFNSLPAGYFYVFCCLLIVFPKSICWKTSFRHTVRVSNSLDPDQARHVVGPDLGPKCLQRLSTDDTSRKRVEVGVVSCNVN